MFEPGGHVRIPRSYCQQTFKNAFFNNTIKVNMQEAQVNSDDGAGIQQQLQDGFARGQQGKTEELQFHTRTRWHGARRIRRADTSHRVLSLRAKSDSVQSNQSQDQELKDSTRKEAISRLATILMNYIMK